MSGAVSTEFFLTTDSPRTPVLKLGLKAILLESLELIALESGMPVVASGRTLERHFEVVERSAEAASHSSIRVKAGGSISTQLGDVKSIVPGPFSTFESKRSLTILIAPSSEIGPHSEEIVFVWNDGTELRKTLTWRVDPLVILSPKTKIINDEGKPVVIHVTIRSMDRPMRILGAEGSILDKFDIDPKKLSLDHSVELTVIPSRNASKTSHVILKTDHPVVPTLVLDILSIRKDQGAR